MKTITALTQELRTGNLRLDASYYASPGVQTMYLLNGWKRKSKQRRFDTLANVCVSGGIFIPGRFRRIYVSDANYGLPWLSPSDMLKADLSDISYVSKKYTQIQDSLRLQRGWLLLSRSGSIGNLVCVRDDMAGMIGSDDIIRILPDDRRIPGGYLFAFLTSSIGKALIQQQTYGAVIQHIEVEHVVNLLIPRLESSLEEHIHALIEQASQLWSKATYKIAKARQHFENFLTGEAKEFLPHNHDISIVSLAEMKDRMGAHYYSGVYRQLEHAIRSNAHKELGNLSSRIFAPPPFKHIYLPTPNLFPFITGGELVNRKFADIRYLAPHGMDDVTDYVVKEGWLAIYKSGQLDSMLGTTFYVDKILDSFCLSDHVIRVLIDQSKIHPMYVYAFLSARVGRLLIIRRAMGKSVPFVREDTIATIPIPILSTSQQQQIIQLVRDAFSMRQKSLEFEEQAQMTLTKALEA